MRNARELDSAELVMGNIEKRWLKRKYRLVCLKSLLCGVWEGGLQ